MENGADVFELSSILHPPLSIGTCRRDAGVPRSQADREFCLFPVAGRPQPASGGGIFIPMAGHPGGIFAGAHFPMTGRPYPMTVDKCPITLNPNVRRAGC